MSFICGQNTSSNAFASLSHLLPAQRSPAMHSWLQFFSWSSKLTTSSTALSQASFAAMNAKHLISCMASGLLDVPRFMMATTIVQLVGLILSLKAFMSCSVSITLHITRCKRCMSGWLSFTRTQHLRLEYWSGSSLSGSV